MLELTLICIKSKIIWCNQYITGQRNILDGIKLSKDLMIKGSSCRFKQRI